MKRPIARRIRLTLLSALFIAGSLGFSAGESLYVSALRGSGGVIYGCKTTLILSTRVIFV